MTSRELFRPPTVAEGLNRHPRVQGDESDSARPSDHTVGHDRLSDKYQRQDHPQGRSTTVDEPAGRPAVGSRPSGSGQRRRGRGSAAAAAAAHGKAPTTANSSQPAARQIERVEGPIGRGGKPGPVGFWHARPGGGRRIDARATAHDPGQLGRSAGPLLQQGAGACAAAAAPCRRSRPCEEASNEKLGYLAPGRAFLSPGWP